MSSVNGSVRSFERVENGRTDFTISAISPSHLREINRQYSLSLLKNTIAEERFKVIDVVRRLGSKLSGLMITCGFLVLAFGVYVLLMPQDPVLSVRLNAIFIGALGFVGGFNIVCGMLLLLEKTKQQTVL
jgi:hypothetical protein